MKPLTHPDIYEAEEACRLAHRKLGIKKQNNTATPRDYRAAERAAAKLEKITRGINSKH